MCLLAACAAIGMAATISVEAQQIAFTWDDLPAHSALPEGETRVDIGRKIIAAMKAEHLPPVYGFVNGIRTQQEPLSTPMLQEWRNAGLLLGNHTWSHMNLNTSTLADWEADVVKNEPLIQSYMGKSDWRWLRFPYLSEGDTPEKRDAARKFLAARGYRIAAVTMSFGDYAYNEPYARCVARKDDKAIQQLEGDYLTSAGAAITYSRAMSKALYGHDIPYVLLMHVGALDAQMLPKLLALYRSRGFTFVSLEAAEQDPFYSNDLDLSLPAFPDSLEAAIAAHHLPPPEPPHSSLDLDSVCR